MNRPEAQQQSVANPVGGPTAGGISPLQRSTPTASPSTASTGTSSPGTPSSNSQTDRRNVAEILASLSGLMPEPPQNLAMGPTTEPSPKVSSNVTITPISSTVMATASATQPPPSIVEAKSRATATILSSNTSNPQSSTRVVRVLQSSKGTMPTSISSLKSATTVVVTPASSSSSSSGGEPFFFNV